MRRVRTRRRLAACLLAWLLALPACVMVEGPAQSCSCDDLCSCAAEDTEGEE